jgi:L-fuculose-phosphate aldolase
VSEASAELLRDFQQVGLDLYRHGLVTSHGGNISVRDGHGMWITGTGKRLGHLSAGDISYVQPGGTYSGPPPSSDTVLHTTVYALSGAQSVVHAHPRHAVAITFDDDLFVPPDFEGQHHLQEVPVIENDHQGIERVASALQSRLVVILRGHGAYARGQTAWEALHWIMALEESAQIAWLKRQWDGAAAGE